MNEELVQSVASQLKCEEQPPGKLALLPWIVFLFATFLFDASLSTLVTTGLYSSLGVVYLGVALICGSVFGQWMMIMVVCGLWGRTWISGYAAAATLLVTAVLTTSCGNLLHEIFIDNSLSIEFEPAVFAIAASLSGILISSAGIIAFRSFRGWRLTRGQSPIPHASFGITDLIIGTGLVALLMIVGNDVKAYGVIATQTFWEPVFTLGLLGCVLGIVAVAPIVWLVFKSTRFRLLKLVAVVIVNCVACGLAGAVIVNMSEAVADPFAVIVALGALWGVIAFSYLVGGLMLLRLAGFHLYTGKGKQDVLAPVVPESRVRQVAVPAAVFGSLLLAHLVLTLATVFEAANDVRFRQSQRDFAARRGELTRDSENEIEMVVVKLWPGATRDDLLRLSEYPNLGTLSLANSAIVDSDLDLLAQFDKLHKLDLSGTAVTDAGLGKLVKCKALAEVSLARTQCTAAGIARLVESVPINSLDLSDLDLRDEDVQNIKNSISTMMNSFVSFALSRNPLTNDGVASFLNSCRISPSIDLTDCQVDETCLSSDSYTQLILDGTQITESGFAAKLQTLLVLDKLSLDRTAVTDKILPFFAGATISKLKFGETQITEQGLIGLGAASLEQLSLNSRKFTGACFSDWKPSFLTLDMSHSGVTDANIAHIARLPALSQLMLRDTAITDASLELLAKSNLQSIDLCDTQITAAGIAKHDWEYIELKITADQFTEAELKFLLPLTTFIIEAPTPSKP